MASLFHLRKDSKRKCLSWDLMEGANAVSFKKTAGWLASKLLNHSLLHFRSCLYSISRHQKRPKAPKVMAEEERNLIEILDENIPIDISKYVNYVQSPHCGAIATFAGTTRDTFEGKTVLELRYEAYVPMAIRCIKSICSSARSSWNLSSIAVAHRLGPVPVGETSVFIATSAVHRADALDACKFMIDEVKASVPIWKKEIYTNGEVWKENSEFLERREELGKPASDYGRGCCGKKAMVEEGSEKRVCCSGKVKMNVADP